ncbi:MAG: hypothetical protein M1423_07435, partial [Acidobacteria bacterium]|nr:hypothetical protein [Acidobacteriota bacterium]
MMTTSKLTIPRHVFHQIVSAVLETPAGLETGVTLFGTSVPVSPAAPSEKPGEAHVAASNTAHVVLAVAGPGKRATHQPVHYSGDENYSNAIFGALASAMPGMRWLGELHVHPQGMTWLSHGDRRTVREILTGCDDTLHPKEF